MHPTLRIAPLGALGRGETSGVPIVADDSCGERLWTVNVAIEGNPKRMHRGVVPQVDLQITKKNTFYANWCSEDPDGSAFQFASIRPAKNLFRLPGLSEGYTPSGGDTKALSSKARVQALLNVGVGEFLTDAYTDGSTTELAGRLLFGEYTLFIPATSLAEVDAAGKPIGDGLVLNQVDDILIRLDYLSVAR